MADIDEQPGGARKGASARLAGPGVLYFDPNPTTARLATAGLRLAGYNVFAASTQAQTVQLCRVHGPGGDGSIVALLLDAAASPTVSGSVLAALVAVPGASDLPGILLVSRANPTPIPGAEGLPALKRPFTIPALLKVLREAVDQGPVLPIPPTQTSSPEAVTRVALTFAEHFPDLQPDAEQLRAFTSSLVAHAEVPTPNAALAVQADLAVTRFESVLSLLADEGARGLVSVNNGAAKGRFHIDRGRIRAAEIKGTEEDLRLGRFVVQAGFMAPGDVETIAQTPDPQRRLLGERLVADGHVSATELGQTLADQALEIACHVLTWREGRVSFAPMDKLHPLAEAGTGPAQLRIADAVLEGLRRTQESAEMGPQMATVDEVYLRNDKEVASFGRNAFTTAELGVLELLNGRNSVKDISRKTRAGTFATVTVLYRLTRARLIRRAVAPT